jgi:DNA polymerase III delta subunit
VPHLMVASAAGTSQRRLVSETTRQELESGYSLATRREGGDWKELLSSENCGGLFETRRLVLVEEAHLLGKFPPGLESLLEGQESATHVLLVYEDDPKAAFPKEIFPRITWLRGEDLPRFGAAKQRWVEERAAKMGIKVSPEGMSLLLESVEDPEEIVSEMTKLALASKDGLIGVEAVRALCFDEGEKALLSLLDGLCEADIRKVTGALSHLRRREVIPVVAALHNRFRVAFYRSVFDAPRLVKAASEALKARPYQERQASEAVRHYDRKRLGEFLKQLCGVNIGEKSGNRTGWLDLELAILGLLGTAKAPRR